MSINIKMPQISEDADSGTIVEIMVNEGDSITEQQSIIAVESDKASVEVPAESSGKVKEIKVAEGDEIQVGDVILVLETEDSSDEAEEQEDDGQVENESNEDTEADEKDEEPTSKKEEIVNDDEEKEDEANDEEEKTQKTEKKQKSDGDQKSSDQVDKEKNSKDQSQQTSKKDKKEVPAAPSVRRMAREMNVDIYALTGSGPGNRITADDIKAAANGHSKTESKSPSTSLPDFTQWGEVERKKMSGIRKATANSMSNAWQTVPHVTQFDKADISTLQEFMKQYESKAEKSGAKLTVTAILVKLSASALRAFPKFNASVDLENQEFIFKKYIHIGVAVDTENGLLVPVIRDADRKSVITITLELNELAQKAREGKLSTAEMKGGTFTVSNLGGIGGTQFTPIVYHPQVAILGVSRNQIEAVYENDKFVPKTILPLSLSYDHRAVDGAEAARFLRWMCQVMEDPFVMLMEGGI